MADSKSRVSYDVASEDIEYPVFPARTRPAMLRPIGDLLPKKENIVVSSGYLRDTGGT